MPKFFNNRIILFLFGLSGAAALVYEVIWARELGLIFGTTVYAVSTVLAVFFSGLALGSFLFGKIVDAQKKPLLLYGLIELGIGLYAIFTPQIFQLIQKLQIILGDAFSLDGFSQWSLLRFILSFGALIIPATLIGGTLPVMIKYFTKTLYGLGNITAKLYSINTFGAALGTILAGFFLILWFGVAGAIYFAAVLNIIIGLVVLFLWCKEKGGFVQEEAGEPLEEIQRVRPDFRLYLIFGAFFLSGFAALALEVLWTRALILTIGLSTYAFSIILITFLLGIALGSLVISRFVDRINVWNAFARLEILRGISVILLIPVFGFLPFWYISIIKQFGWSFGVGISASFIITILVLLVPTLLMGATFPVVAKIVTRQFKSLGFSIGRAYLFNTLGGVAGSLAAGFFLVPLLGVQNSIVLAAALYLLVGSAITLFSPTSKTPYKVAVAIVAVGFIMGGAMLPDWNRLVLQSRVFTHAPLYAEQSSQEIKAEIERGEFHGQLIFYKEGISSLVAVEQRESQKVLSINGKIQASSEGDKEPHLFFGHLPVLLHPNPKTAMVIGLGTGMTLGAVEQHPELEKVTVVEIEPEVVEAASFFADANSDALNDPRLRVVIEDARNYLLMTEERFDVISSQPSHIWIKGMAHLYTKEFFELAKNHLNEDGLMVQWIQIYSISKENLLSFVATFQSVFPQVSIWEAMNSVILVGSENDLDTFDVAKINQRLTEESVGQDLARIKVESTPALFGYFVVAGEAINEFTSGLSLHTDNRPFLEFSSPKSFYQSGESLLENLEFLKDLRVPAYNFVDSLNQATKDEIQKYFDLRTQSIENELLNQYAYLTEKFELENNYKEAEKYYKKLVHTFPENSLAWRGLGVFYARLARFEEAEEAFLQSLALDPHDFNTYVSLGSVYRATGDLPRAIEAYKKALEINPNEKKIQDIILQLGGHLSP